MPCPCPFGRAPRLQHQPAPCPQPRGLLTLNLCVCRVLSKHKKAFLYEMLSPLKWIFSEETTVSKAARKAAEEAEKKKKVVVRKVKQATHAAAESIESAAHAADDAAHAAAHLARSGTMNLLHLLPDWEQKTEESTAEVSNTPTPGQTSAWTILRPTPRRMSKKASQTWSWTACSSYAKRPKHCRSATLWPMR